jgi:hypothetical protein
MTAVAVAVLCAGCGGHSATSPKAFAGQFNAATTAYQSRMSDVQTKARTALKSHASANELDVYRQLLTATDKSVSQFRALTPPASAKSAFTAMVQALTTQEQALKDILAAASAGDATRLTTAVQSYGTALEQWQQQRSQVETALSAGSTAAAATP